MTEITIRGVSVMFPFEPYDIQKVYMEKVISCLQQGVNGVLESPTGTGKTLCLLCASLAWAEAVRAQQAAAVRSVAELQPEFYAALTAQLDRAAGTSTAAGHLIGAPKIIFASRTHSQLSQVVQELKRTSYRYVKAVVIGSRDQLCIHPEVSKETNHSVKVHMCQVKVKSRTCLYYNQVDSRRTDKHLTDMPVADIEDLVTVGKKLNFCPYYMARSLREAADIIFMPYNYLLDPKTRKANGVELQNSVVIFDEAHNIEKMCEESASLQLKSTDIALCCDEITHVLSQLVSPEASAEPEFASPAAAADINPENLALLKTMLLELEKAIDAISIKNPVEGVNFPGSFMFELLEKAEITHGKRTIIVEELEKVITFLTSTATSVFSRRGNGLQTFVDLIKVVFSRDQFDLSYMNRIKKCYKVHVCMEQQRTGAKRGRNDPWAKANTSPDCRVLSYWCFSPGFGMSELMEQGVKTLLLTSGTLAPLGSFTSELQIPFPVSLENEHIISGDQVWVGCISRGPDGTALTSTYQNRSSPRYLNSLGQTIANVSKIVPDGLLIFFPSYAMLKQCQEAWEQSGVWARIAANKPVFVETGGKEVFAQNMADYYGCIHAPTTGGARGACFMAVCRGKVSEGLDFADRNGRAVLITGLPYPPLKDPRVVLKRQYLDEVRKEPGAAHSLSGQEWYRLEAWRAVNQAVGRVIRHRRDYGAVILCDERFSDAALRGHLSAWVRPHLSTHANFGPVVRQITAFFRACQAKYPCASGAAVASSGGSRPVPVAHASFEWAPSRPVADAGSTAVPTETGPAPGVCLTKLYGGTAAPGGDARTATSGAPPLLDVMNQWSGGGRDQTPANNASSPPLAQDDEQQYVEGGAAAQLPPVKHTSKYKLSHNPAELLLKSGCVPRTTEVMATPPARITAALHPELRPSGGTGATTEVMTTPPVRVTAAQHPELRPSGGIFGVNPTASVPSTNNTHNPPAGKHAEKKNKSKIADFILGAKQLLPAPDYRAFAAAVKLYNSTRDYQQMVSDLAAVLVFGGDRQLHALFRGFAPFVRPEHRKQFAEACSQLTGSER